MPRGASPKTMLSTRFCRGDCGPDAIRFLDLATYAFELFHESRDSLENPLFKRNILGVK